MDSPINVFECIFKRDIGPLRKDSKYQMSFNISENEYNILTKDSSQKILYESYKGLWHLNAYMKRDRYILSVAIDPEI